MLHPIPSRLPFVNLTGMDSPLVWIRIINNLSKYLMMKYNLILPAFFACLLLISQPAYAASINPKEITSATVKITSSGMLVPSGSVQSASLTLYIAQDGGQNVSVTPSDWEFVNDANGNRMVRMHFKDLSQPQSYSVTQTVKTVSQRLDNEAPLDGDAEYTAETSGAQITPNISASAYPFERTLAGVAGMSAWVHDYMTYDKSLFGMNKPSDWVLSNRRGVCVEYSNLLAAMLRSRGIAARYASGYAYSNEDNGLIAHAWLEVLAGGRWVGFDPTWLEGGFIDATHVKTSVSLDGVEKKTLTYMGTGGTVQLNDNPDSAELLEYATANETAISLEAPQNVPLEGGGYIKATVSGHGCRIAQLKALSCTDNRRKSLISIQGGDRDIWFCGSASVFWAFTNSLPGGYTYNCPVLVYDQSGAEAEKAISISGSASGVQPTISGPDSAGVSRSFTIQASAGSTLFSTELGEGSSPWTLALKSPGAYNFYAYGGGMLAHKAVSVSASEEFELSASAPAQANQSTPFLVTASLKNIGGTAKAVTVKATFGNQSQEQQASLGAGESRQFEFNFTAYDAGDAKYMVSALSDSYTGYSGSIYAIPAPEKPKGMLDAILEALQGFLDWLMDILRLK